MPKSSFANDEHAPLKEVGRSKGIRIGSAIRARPARDVAAIVARECDLLTPENALKPAHLSPARGKYRWSDADRTYKFAKSKGLAFHGHTLFWYKRPPPWAEETLGGRSFADATEVYGDFLRDVVERYPRAVSWDVLNEITGTNGLLRDVFPLSTFGVDLVAELLRRARSAAPDAALVINENDLECGASDCAAKRRNVLTLLRQLKERDAPLDVLGVQGHLNSSKPPDTDAVQAFFGEVEALGLDIYLSELDVRDREFDGDDLARDDQVAGLYWTFLTAALQSRAVKRVVFWGITDAENWLATGKGDGHTRARPALFDRSFDRKQAYYAVKEALSSAPER